MHYRRADIGGGSYFFTQPGGLETPLAGGLCGRAAGSQVGRSSPTIKVLEEIMRGEEHVRRSHHGSQSLPYHRQGA